MPKVSFDIQNLHHATIAARFCRSGTANRPSPTRTGHAKLEYRRSAAARLVLPIARPSSARRPRELELNVIEVTALRQPPSAAVRLACNVQPRGGPAFRPDFRETVTISTMYVAAALVRQASASRGATTSTPASASPTTRLPALFVPGPPAPRPPPLSFGVLCPSGLADRPVSRLARSFTPHRPDEPDGPARTQRRAPAAPSAARALRIGEGMSADAAGRRRGVRRSPLQQAIDEPYRAPSQIALSITGAARQRRGQRRGAREP